MRRTLVEQTAALLARREPVTLRAIATAAGTSTMAVYTHFDGMPGLWRAVRQEGFTRLAARLAAVPTTADPVTDLMALGSAYVANAVAHPDLYRTMFDAIVELDDQAGADAGFEVLVTAAERAVAAGRFAAGTDARTVATQVWATGHGIVSLHLGGVLPLEAVDALVPPTIEALFVAAGDDPARCRRSIRRGWRLPDPPAVPPEPGG